MSDDKRPDSENPKFGYGDLDSRPDIDGTEAVDNAYPNARTGQTPSDDDGGPANDNARQEPGS